MNIVMDWLGVSAERYALTFLAVYVPWLIVLGFNCNRKTVIQLIDSIRVKRSKDA